MNENLNSVTLKTSHKLKITKASWDRQYSYENPDENLRLWVKIAGNGCNTPSLLCSLNSRDADKPLDLVFEKGATITLYTDDQDKLKKYSKLKETAAVHLTGYYIIGE